MYHQRKLGGLSLKTQGNIYFQINIINCKNTFTISENKSYFIDSLVNLFLVQS